MIPKEKIEQAANKYAIKVNKGFEGSELIVRRVASENDFKSGVRFAETELQLIAIEFSEWFAINKYQYNETYKYWHDGRITYKSDTLYAIFMAERQSQ